MNEHHITISKTARYYTLGNLNSNTKQILIAIHGWGMSVKDFMESLAPLLTDDMFIVAPEALNRFYLKGSGGQVGATWMTKEDRLNEIKDYISYLDTLYNSLGLDVPGAKVTALGFSQGASTVTRWVNSFNCRVDDVIVFAGEVAPELLPLADSSGLKQTRNYFICGTHDQIFTPPMVAEMRVKYADMNFTEFEFTGRHEINTDVLKKIPL